MREKDREIVDSEVIREINESIKLALGEREFKGINLMLEWSYILKENLICCILSDSSLVDS